MSAIRFSSAVARACVFGVLSASIAQAETTVVLRDGVGEPPAVGVVGTGSGWQANIGGIGANFAISIFESPVDIVLAHLEIAAAQLSISGNLGAQSFILRIWSTPEDAAGHPLQGTLYNVPIAPTEIVYNIGTLSGPYNRPIHLLKFDLSALDISLSAGQTVAFNIAMVTPSNAYGLYGVVEALSDPAGSPETHDIKYTSSGLFSLCSPEYVSFCTATGRVAMKLVAVATSCAGDLSGDGTIGGADLAVLLGAWGSCSACNADIDASGTVDAADLAILLGAWGACS